MLNICTDTLPQSCLSYLAFRISFQDTLERIVLAQQIGNYGAEKFGYLTEVPFLRSVPPHVQLDLLAQTWNKHISEEPMEADLLDESVVYAACEWAGLVVEQEPTVVPHYLKGGPLDVRLPVDHWLASELRALHLNLSNDGDFLLISQFEDLPPDDSARLKEEFRLDPERLELMFEVLSRWHVSDQILANLNGLLTEGEQQCVERILGLKRCAGG